MNIENFRNLKLSERIRLVLKDVELCEKDDNVVFDMDMWRILDVNGMCKVCIAGALIHKSFKDDYPHQVQSRVSSPCDEIVAFDSFRRGGMLEFLHLSLGYGEFSGEFYVEFGVSHKFMFLSEKLEDIYNSYCDEKYHDEFSEFNTEHRPAFKEMMSDCADYLEQQGC